jgi:hypothetical protein
MIKLPSSKKARAHMAQQAAVIVAAILSIWQIELTPVQQMGIVALAMFLMTWGQAAYSKAQGMADAGSNGATSSSAKTNGQAAAVDIFMAIKAADLEIKPKRKSPARKSTKKPKDEPAEDTPPAGANTGKWAPTG